MNILIEWIYRTPKGAETVFRSEEMPAEQAIAFCGRLRANRTCKKHSYSLIGSTAHGRSKSMKGYLKGIETEPHNVTVYFDGGFDLATSKAGLGCVIYYEQSGKPYRLRRNAPSAELTSNNEAEYAALHLGLQELELLNVHHLPVRFIGDSQVVINQLTEELADTRKCSVGLGRPDRRETEKTSASKPEYELVQRKLNSEADRLATQALNGVSITATSEITMD